MSDKGNAHMTGTFFMQGNIACAEGAIASGCRFFAGYPITPSTEVAEWLASRLPKVGGTYIQMEDEIASMAAIIGASWAGKKAMTATSGPGFSLMMENIGFAAMTETPCVVVNIQRGGPSTGQPTMAAQGDVMQCKWGSQGDYEIIALSPNSVQEMFSLTVECFNLSERYRVPAFLMADEVVGHMREKVVLPGEVKTEDRPLAEPGDLPYDPKGGLIPGMPVFGRGHRVHITGLTHDERGYPDTSDPASHSRLVTRLNDKIRKNVDDIAMVEEFYTEDADIILISYGGTSRSVLQAVLEMREEGIKAGSLRLITLWPFPEGAVEKYSDRKLAVFEMNLGQVVREVERAAGKKAAFMPKIGGDVHTPDEIKAFVRDLK
jgi:2-oxoglutarate ferredoxin oxidoreductase subunit alpha